MRGIVLKAYGAQKAGWAAACTFCRVVATGSSTTEYMQMLQEPGSPLPPLQYRMAGSFLLLAEVAPLTAGHLLVVPRPHVLALALMSPAEHEEYETVRRELGIRMTKEFATDSYVAFEHGTGKTSAELLHRVKCGPTEHAHLHLMPNTCGRHLLASLASFGRRGGYTAQHFRTGDWSTHREALGRSESSYHMFLVGDTEGEDGVLFRPPDGAMPSQYFRRFIATAGSVATDGHNVRADWRDEVVFADPAVLRDVLLTVSFLQTLPGTSSSSHSGSDTA